MGISLKNITKKYNENSEIETTVLNNVSLNINSGELVAIKGQSGAGKSTLLHIIGCLDTVTTGEYYLDDMDVSKMKNRELAKVRNEKFGFVMQDFGLINEDSVTVNVSLPLMLGNKKISNINSRVMQCLKMLGVSHLNKRCVESLSGGEKQRVAIARALVNNPEYILADEPTGALDNKNTQIIIDILKKLNEQGKTVIIITHDDNVANQCNRIINISDGIIL